MTGDSQKTGLYKLYDPIVNSFRGLEFENEVFWNANMIHIRLDRRL